MVHRGGWPASGWGLVVLGAWFFLAEPAPAQTLKAERELFAQVKAEADAGDAEAQLKLAVLYANGLGVAQDPGKAAKCHRKAAEQGFARGQYELGLDYTRGFGVKRDAAEGFRWFRRAAEQGLPEAQVELGLCFSGSSGVNEDPAEAARWFRKAAEQGHAEAEYQLSRCCFEGRGVTKDTTAAVIWLRRAAGQGNAAAQNRLGVCYERGEGVTRDLIQAHKWFNLAAAQDATAAPDIRVSLAKVETQMTQEQIAEAQRLAREFRPGREAAPPGGMTSATSSEETNSTTADSGTCGFVNVKADDDASEVFADSAFVGNPPARLKLAAGTHVIEVKRSGFKDYRREITVTAGSDLNLRVTLDKR
jgi:TPR repeat protein